MRIAAIAVAVLAASASASASTPPRQLLYLGEGTEGGLRLLDLARGTARTVVPSAPDVPVSAGAWSPDGGRIAYAAGGALFVVAADGTGRRRVSAANAAPLAWSPDGRWIAAVRYGRNIRVFAIRSDGSGLRDVAAGSNATWTRDSRHLVAEDPRRGLVLVGITGGTRRMPHGAHAGDPSLSPDGSRVAFSLQTGEPWQFGIAVERIDGSGFRVLTRGDADHSDNTPAWSPDGRTIAFTRGYYHQPLEYSGIVTVPSAGGRTRPLEDQFTGHDERPRWSPDGRTIAFDRDAAVEPIGEDVQLMVVDVASRQARVLARPVTRWSQAWRPR